MAATATKPPHPPRTTTAPALPPTITDVLNDRIRKAQEKARPQYFRLVHKFAAGDPHNVEELDAAATRAGFSRKEIDAHLKSIERKKELEGKLRKLFGDDHESTKRHLDAERIRLTSEIEATKLQERQLLAERADVERKCHAYIGYTLELNGLKRDELFTTAES